MTKESYPLVLMVMGREYKVEFSESIDEFGHLDGDKGIIRVHSSKDHNVQHTILHELLHAILFEAGLHHAIDDGMEEAIVRALEHGITRSGFLEFQKAERQQLDNDQLGE